MALEQFRLDGQVAIVTGAGKGVGAGIARVLAEAGATVVGTARTESEIVGTMRASRTRRQGAGARRGCDKSCLTVSASSTRPWSASAASIFSSTMSVAPPTARFLDITDEDFRHTFDWCVTSAFIMSQLAAPHMLSAGHGSIINISSGSARFGIRALTAYCVAKGGLEALTRAMAQELAPKIRVNAIALGFIRHRRPARQPGLDARVAGKDARVHAAASPGRRRRPGTAYGVSVHSRLLCDQRDLPRRRRHRLEQFATADTRLLSPAALCQKESEHRLRGHRCAE